MFYEMTIAGLKRQLPLCKVTDDLYKLSGSKFDKDTRMFTRTTKDGKKIRYSADDLDAVERYTPVKVKDSAGRTIGWRSKDGKIE